MANRFYGIAVGGQLPKDVTEDSSTTSAAIELRVADTAYTTKKHVLMALEGLVAYMQTKETSPIA